MIVAIFGRAFKGVSLPHRLTIEISLVSVYCLLSAQMAAADPPGPTAPDVAPPSAAPLSTEKRTANLDGLYLLVSIGGGALRNEGEWDSTIGGQLTVVNLAESSTVSLIGVDIGVSQYGALEGGRAWAGPVVGFRPLGVLIGASTGITAEWDRTEAPLLGASASIWAFAGLVPYLTIGKHERIGGFAEVGVRLTLPAARFSRKSLW